MGPAAGRVPYLGARAPTTTSWPTQTASRCVCHRPGAAAMTSPSSCLSSTRSRTSVAGADAPATGPGGSTPIAVTSTSTADACGSGTTATAGLPCPAHGLNSRVRAAARRTLQLSGQGRSLTLISTPEPLLTALSRLQKRDSPWDTRAPGGLRLLNPGSPTDRRRQPHCTYMTCTARNGELDEVALHRLPRR